VAADQLGADEVRERAVGGAAVLGARGALVYLLGIGANIGLARLLAPRDFGIVALGSVLLVVGTYLTDGGMGAALIRGEREPERIDLEAVAGLQLVVGAALAAIGAAGAAAFGRDGLIVATMLASLPIASARIAPAIVLERELRYRPIALADLVEAVTYYAWALVAVALGAGVWGMATAVVVRSIAGVATIVKVGPVGFVRPRWRWARVRPLVAFGAKLQAAAVVAIVRDQGLNIGIATISGVATLGIWSLVYRVLQVPLMVVNTAVRVSFPTMARMLDAREDPRALIERGIGTVAVCTAFILVGLVGCAPALLPALLGERWADVPPTLLWSSLGLLLTAPVIVAAIGYLYATGRAGTVLWATVWHTLAWFAVAFPLLPVVGAPAVGLGWIPAGLVMSAIVGHRTAQLTGAAVVRSVALPSVIAAAAGAAGWELAASGGETVARGAAGLVLAEALLFAGLWVARRSLLASTGNLLGTALGRFRPRRA
jgi:O-antigen/teichoic acid export membrane protein